MLERRYLLFKFVFLLLKVKDRLGGIGGIAPMIQFNGIFEIFIIRWLV